MQARGVDADVVTCCSLISALERGGQWHLAQQLFLDMCRAAAAAGSPQVVICVGNCVYTQIARRLVAPATDRLQLPMSAAAFAVPQLISRL
jgi:pentatricopeptide repeat protein